MSFQVIETSKLEFVGIVASRLMHDFKFELNRSTFRYLANSLKKGVKWSTSGQKILSILLSSNSKHKFRTKFGPKTLWETRSPMRLCTAKGSFGPLKKGVFIGKIMTQIIFLAVCVHNGPRGNQTALEDEN